MIALVLAGTLAAGCGPPPELPPPARQAAFEQVFSPPTAPPPPPPPGPPDGRDAGHGWWPRHVVQTLERRAARGDGAAAWELSVYYGMIRHDGARAQTWLDRATDLRHPEAERHAAYLIRLGLPFSRYGSSGPAAVERLLTDACRSNGSACHDLAEAHESGYFGRVDLTVARDYYQRGANQGHRMSWQVFSRYLRDGLGGPVDQARAYFWMSLEARCVDPRSVGGQDTWRSREALAVTLDLDVLEREWAAVDAFMAEYDAGQRAIDFDPFLGTGMDEASLRQGKREADQRERAHRASLRKAKGTLAREAAPR